ncbi:CHAT domain-containing protein [Xylaria arbuscula]|nr:CHAT domain-containing protein [Xylaria arbuscula]
MSTDPTIPSPGKDNVLRGLQACRIFYFAGHGHSDPAEPLRSCLLLEDWNTNPLTVGDLPFLGFLSACSTGANKAAKLADEGINLINAFQLAWFWHVTLRDEGITDVAVCRGLHRAVRALRDRGIAADGTRDGALISGTTEARGSINAYWIPYVHFGI